VASAEHQPQAEQKFAGEGERADRGRVALDEDAPETVGEVAQPGDDEQNAEDPGHEARPVGQVPEGEQAEAEQDEAGVPDVGERVDPQQRQGMQLTRVEDREVGPVTQQAQDSDELGDGDQEHPGEHDPEPCGEHRDGPADRAEHPEQCPGHHHVEHDHQEQADDAEAEHALGGENVSGGRLRVPLRQQSLHGDEVAEHRQGDH
jgi:hypothetical protein